MKIFFDRLSDCLKIEKETGRKLRGKNMAVLSCGSDDTETEGFFVPFRKSAAYLGMNYLADKHTWLEDGLICEEVAKRVQTFAGVLKKTDL